MNPRLSQLLRRVATPVLLFAILTGFYWKITLTRQYEWIWGYDLAAQVLPWFEVEARQWHGHMFPLWDPYLWGGQPLLAQAQPGAAYPLNWLLFSFPLRGGHIQHGVLQWYFVVIRFMAALFCYWLCRDLGRSRAASVAGGIAFSLSGYLATTGWPQMASGAVWMPLVFLFLLRAVRGRNTIGSAALSGLFLGMAWLSGHHQVPTFTTAAFGLTWLFFIFRKGRLDVRLARAAAVALVFTALTGALQILPAYEYGHLAKRWVSAPQPVGWNDPVPYSVHEQYDLKGFNLLGIVIPGVVTHSNPFVGIAALSLALLGLAACWRDVSVRLLSAIGIGGLIYSLGHYTVFQGFFYAAVPGMEKARTPSAAIVIFQFGVAVLAAFGIDRLAGDELSPWLRRISWTALGFGALTFLICEAILLANRNSFPLDDHVVVTALSALLVAALLYAAARAAVTARQAGVLAVLLILLDLGSDPNSTLVPRDDKQQNERLDQMRANEDVARYLKKQPGYYRANVSDDLFPPNWGAYQGIEMWGGALASVTNNMLDFEFHRYPARMAFGVAWSLGTKPPPDPADEVFAGKSGLKVYRHPAVFPRAWAVHNLVRVKDMEAGNQWIVNRTEELHTTAFLLEQPPPLESCSGPDDVRLYDHRGSFIGIRAHLACKGMVILSDTYFPGWHAYVDGRAAQIYPVNGPMRGVVVPAGDHSVTMRYRPASVVIGALCTLLGIVGAVLAISSKVRPRSSP